MLTDRDKIHLGVIATVDTLAIITNITLMGAIIFKTPKPLRIYSVFLLNNAIIDFFSATSSILGVVRLVDNHAEGSMIFVFLGPCSMISEYLCRLSQGIHVNLVLQSTVILLFSFVYRLYILSDLFREKPPSRLQVWMICLVTYGLISIPIVVYYFTQDNVTAEVAAHFGIEGYTAANFYFLDTPALLVLFSATILLAIVIKNCRYIEGVLRILEYISSNRGTFLDQ